MVIGTHYGYRCNTHNLYITDMSTIINHSFYATFVSECHRQKIMKALTLFSTVQYYQFLRLQVACRPFDVTRFCQHAIFAIFADERAASLVLPCIAVSGGIQTKLHTIGVSSLKPKHRGQKLETV